MTPTIGPPLSTLITAAGMCSLGVAAGLAVKAVRRLLQETRLRDRQRRSLKEYLQETLR